MLPFSSGVVLTNVEYMCAHFVIYLTLSRCVVIFKDYLSAFRLLLTLSLIPKDAKQMTVCRTLCNGLHQRAQVDGSRVCVDIYQVPAFCFAEDKHVK